MSNEHYQILFQLISSIGVIASVIYLGYQIRQNSKIMRRAASRDMVRDLNELGRFIIEIPELASIYIMATEEPDQLSTVDRFRFQALLREIFSNFDLALAYHGDGLISDTAAETYTRSVVRLFESPVVTEWWRQDGRTMYSERLQSRISGYLPA